MTRLHQLSLALSVALFLSACGIKGGIKTPPPLFGDAPKVVEGEEPGSESEVEDADVLEDEDPFYGPDIQSGIRDRGDN